IRRTPVRSRKTARCRRPRTLPAAAWLLALWLPCTAASTLAQDLEASAADPSDAAGPGGRPEAIELDTIRVIEKRPEWVDPFAFRPSFDPHDNIFHRRWNEPPSVEDVSMGGGYILLGINYGLLKAAEAVTRLPGWQNQIQPAAARPPPLDEAQAERAARLREAGEP